MGFDGGTAYAESDADDEYERGHSPINDSEHSPIDSELSTSAEHTPTTYGHRSSADRLPETIITEWTAEECADFIASVGLQQYADRFIGAFLSLDWLFASRLAIAAANLIFFLFFRKRDCRRSSCGIAPR